MGEKQQTIALMAATVYASQIPELDDVTGIAKAGRDAVDLYEAVERELSKRRTTPQG